MLARTRLEELLFSGFEIALWGRGGDDALGENGSSWVMMSLCSRVSEFVNMDSKLALVLGSSSALGGNPG